MDGKNGRAASRLRTKIESGKCVWLAGAYDALSATLAQQAGFEGIFTTGLGISASHLGRPDIELYTMTENLAVTSAIAEALPHAPIISDCDTGYGDVRNVIRTVRNFERAGVAGVVLEDQVSPKRCPLLPGVPELNPVDDAVAKIEAACAARNQPETLIIARTDAQSMDECIARARAYAEAGADLVQPTSVCVQSFDDLLRLKREVPKPISLMVLSWLEVELAPAQIEQVAGLATFPLVGLLSTVRALQENYTALAAHHDAGKLPREKASLKEFEHIWDDFMDATSRLVNTGTRSLAKRAPAEQ
ncbi:isocitrate lyase/PEP mutase family protein [Verticiella sediminum]|uniref:Isocitrate lyase/PEP mutase family protein n=1 Tax=Verticiella sediminum TaxID=1247510 RepID=A0A556AKC1_9BURK|nr:isocitrate lyase/PEP mutase family protein [Verticiella sediminum]TSH93342.1 isocitrate lyase/PEP mutase family protein [Verticiella sediminum]